MASHLLIIVTQITDDGAVASYPCISLLPCSRLSLSLFHGSGIEFSSVGPSGAWQLPSLCLNSSVKQEKKGWLPFFSFLVRIPLVGDEAAAAPDAAPQRFQLPRLVAAAPQSCASPYIVPQTQAACLKIPLLHCTLSLYFCFPGCSH